MKIKNKGIESLPPPPHGFDPCRKADLQPEARGIVSLCQATDEDRARSCSVGELGQPEAWGKYPTQISTASEIEEGLDRMLDDGVPFRSLASAANMQHIQRNLTGHLWALGHAVGYADRSFTIMPRDWEIPAWKLPYFDAKQKMRATYQLLRDYGAGMASGYLVAGMHGEYVKPQDTWRIHLHGVAYGEMIDVLDTLRASRKFSDLTQMVDGKTKRRSPIRIRRKPMNRLPDPYSYVLQLFWPSRVFLHAVSGEEVRGPRRRIPEPHHAALLVWLHQRAVSDITIMMGLQASPRGLKRTR